VPPGAATKPSSAAPSADALSGSGTGSGATKAMALSAPLRKATLIGSASGAHAAAVGEVAVACGRVLGPLR
jgi:hypothetical protein